MMSVAQISDEVWAGQNPSGGRLPMRTVRRVGLAVVVLLAGLIAVPVLTHEGAFGSQLRSVDDGWNGMFVEPDGQDQPAMVGTPVSSDVSGTLMLHNGGWSTVRVLAVTVAAPGIRFDHATVGDTSFQGNTVHPGGTTLGPRHIVPLGPGANVTLTLYLRVTDCRAVPAGRQFATLRVSTWRGVRSVRVALPTVRDLDGGWTIAATSDPKGVSAARYLADAVCGTLT